MINKEIIVKSIDDAIMKCKPSYRKNTFSAFKRLSEEYDFDIKDNVRNHNPDNFITLYDKENNTYIHFNKRFIDENKIDYTGDKRNEGKISIDKLFEYYSNLPDKIKSELGSIYFEKNELMDRLHGANQAHFISTDENNKSDGEFEYNSISIVPEAFDKDFNKSSALTLEYIITHESGHIHDFYKIPQEYLSEGYIVDKDMQDLALSIHDSGMDSMNIYSRAEERIYSSDIFDFEGKHNPNYDVFNKYKDLNDNYLDTNFNKNNIDINDEFGDNELDMGFKVHEVLGYSSDYGSIGADEENYADSFAMSLLGHDNPDNPNAKVIWRHQEVQFRKWIKYHPYIYQGIVKDVYGEDISINEILDLSI